MPGSKRWTDEEVGRLRTLWLARFNYHDIGVRLGRTAQAIHSKSRELKLGARKPLPKLRTKAPEVRDRWTPEQDATFRRRWDDGVSLKGIAAELGKTYLAAKHRRHILALTPRKEGRFHEVKVHVEEALYRSLARRARNRGMTMSSYVRSLVMSNDWD